MSHGMGAGPEGTVSVLGATGNTGRHVIQALLARGVPVIAVSRDPAGAQVPDGVDEVRAGDYRDPTSLRSAVRGSAAAYVIPPTFAPDEAQLIAAAALACREADVPRVVLHSVLHPHTPTMAHHLRKADGEDALRRTGLDWTVLQPSMYLDTVSRTVLSGATGGVVPVPWDPAARLSAVHLGDVAEVAARVLVEDGHTHATYELAGPQALSVIDMVAAISASAGRPLRVEQVDVEAVNPYPVGSTERATLTAMCREYGDHGLRGNPRVLEMLLGRPPTSFSAVLSQDAGAPADG